MEGKHTDMRAMALPDDSTKMSSRSSGDIQQRASDTCQELRSAASCSRCSHLVFSHRMRRLSVPAVLTPFFRVPYDFRKFFSHTELGGNMDNTLKSCYYPGNGGRQKLPVALLVAPSPYYLPNPERSAILFPTVSLSSRFL